MNFITFILSLLYLLLAGTNTSAKNSLHKKPTHEDNLKNFNRWCERNFGIIAFTAVIILLITFFVICFILVGVSATESGVYYNHLGGVI